MHGERMVIAQKFLNGKFKCDAQTILKKISL